VRFDAAAAVRSRIVVLGGNDPHARHTALAALLQEVGGDEAEVETFTADQRPASEWLGLAGTAPFFADRRVVVVRNARRAEPETPVPSKVGKDHPFVASALALPDFGLLVIVLDDEVGHDDRDRPKAEPWSKLAQAAGGTVYAPGLDSGKLPDQLRAEAERLGKSLSAAAATALAEICAGKPVLAMAELEKLALYVGDSPAIRESDVRTVATPEPEYRVFQLGDAVAAGDAGQVLRLLRQVFAMSRDVSGEVIPRVLPVLRNQFRLLWQARFCLDSGCPLERPHPEVLAWLPEKNVSTEPDWRQGRLAQTAGRLTMDALDLCLELLVDLDAKLKGARPYVNATEDVERTLLAMADACRPKPRASAGR
jgi:DNA polymerase III delta subunit